MNTGTQLVPDSFWIDDLPCVFRSEDPTGEDVADLCSIQGKKCKTYDCELFRVCTIQPRKRTMKSCRYCERRLTSRPLTRESSMRSINPLVGITVAPRPGEPTLPRCVWSLREAGVTRIIVFAEPGSDLRGLPEGVHIRMNEKRLGAWHNWLSMSRFLVDYVDNQLIMTVQDDTVFSKQSMTLEWPEGPIGFISPYAPSHYQECWKLIGPHGFITSYPDSKSAEKALPYYRKCWIEHYVYPQGTNRVVTKSMWGACSLIFERESLKSIINHRTARTWLGVIDHDDSNLVLDRKEHPEKIANVDTAIGVVCNELGLSMYFVNPSTAQHIGEHTTIPGHGGLGGRRQAKNVVPDLAFAIP